MAGNRNYARGCLPLVMATVVLVFTGCAFQGSGPTAPRSSTEGEGAITPKVPRVVLAITPPNIESNRPSVAYLTNFWQLAPMYEYLMGVGTEGQEPIPQLATKWSLEPDGKSYRFTLQSGIQFHNGNGKLTAQDVRHSWQILKTEAEPPVSGQVAAVSQQIQDVEIINDHELVFRLNKPDSGFLPAIGQAENVLPISSKVDWESRARPASIRDKPPAGTGPYQYLEREQVRYLRYQRPSDKHWRQTPDFPEFEFRFIKESSTILAALLAREVQMVALPPELADQGEQAGFKSILGKAAGPHMWMVWVGITMNKRFFPGDKLNPDPNAPFVFMNTPLLDVRVRKALNKAIDRDALNKAFLKGKGENVYNQFFHPTRPGWNPAWQQNFKEAYGYDPEAAKKLLAEAGYGPNRPLSHTVQFRPSAYFPAVLDMDEAIANYWRAVGVDVKLDQSDSATFSARGSVPEYDNHSYVFPSSIRQLAGAYIHNTPQGNARVGAQLPELDELMGQIRATLDPKQYDALWRKWGDLAYERYVNIPLFWFPARTVVDPNVIGDYIFPGSISGTYTHVEHIKAAR